MYIVSKTIAAILVSVFVLYAVQVVTQIPCTTDIKSIFVSNFVHIDKYHILANLIALYALARIEKRVGTKMFLSLVLFLLALTTLIEVIARKVLPEFTCSIGFSGVLIGIFVWELVTTKGKIDIPMLLSILTVSVGPSLFHSDVSLSAHIIGAISGIIGGLMFVNLSSNSTKVDKRSY